MSDSTAVLDQPSSPAAEQSAPAAPEPALASAAPEASPPANGPTVVDYDWQVPRRFIPAEGRRLQDYAAKAAARVATDLAGFLRTPVTIQAGPVTEHYAAEAWNAAEAPAYWTPLADKENRACGLLAFPPAVAIGWIEHLLGGKAPPDAARRELTALESALLLDIAAVITKALAASLREAGGPEFQHVESLAADPASLAGQGSAECCRFMLTAGTDAGNGPVGVVLASDLLAPVANPQAATQKPRPPQEIRQNILKHLEGVAVSATVHLGTATVTMRGIADLEIGDVLLLNGSVGEPICLLVRETPSHMGLPVQCEGAFAFQVLDQRQWPRLSIPGKDSPK